MIKWKEIGYVWNQNWFHAGLMTYTAVMVPLTDFRTGVLSAVVIYAVQRRFVEPKPDEEPEVAGEEHSSPEPPDRAGGQLRHKWR